jgi:localization factor PodJL
MVGWEKIRMSAGAPWSVKGIDPKAREIAKDLARRSGMTLGDWLNSMIMEGDEEEQVVPLARRTSPYGGPDRRGRLRRIEDAYDEREPARTPFREQDDLARVMQALELLSTRLEAAENRSTLAIGGVDQAVGGLLARLENNEREQSATASRLEHVAEDLRDGQGRVVDRMRELEREASGPRSVEALRALETALGKIANQVFEGDARTRVTLTETREDLIAVARRMDRIEAKGPGSDAQLLVEGVVSRIAERLEQAEARTAGAIKTLESSFSHLDDRLRSTETRLDADRETRFDKLAGDLSQRVDEARSELIRRFDTTADGRFDQVDRGLAELAGHVQTAEKRSAQAIERMGHEVLRIAQNLNRRMTGVERSSAHAVERVGGEMARVAHAVENRLRKADETHVHALEKLGADIANISERLSERIAHSERRSALSADDVGERIGRVADKLEARYERASGELAERIRLSEERTAKLLEEARETIDRSLARTDQRLATPEPPPAPAPAARAEPPAQAWPAAPPVFPEAQAEPDSIFDEPAPAFPAFPAAAAPEPEARVQAQPEPGPEAFDDFFAAPEAPPAHIAQTGFDDFNAETEFVNSQEFRPGARPAVSTKEAIDAARAAARLGVRNSGAEAQPLFGGGKRDKNKLQQRLDKETKREGGSTLKSALLASGVAMVLASSVVGYWLLIEDGGDRSHQHSGSGLKVLASDLFQDGSHANAAPLAAVAIAEPGSPPATGDQAEAQNLYQSAVSKMSDGGNSDGVTQLSRAANLGYAPAQFFLASLYTTGESGVRKDPAEARRWTERAALGGERKAMFNLGMFFFEGTGGPKDETEAANWFKKAADLGLVDSQYNLARLYEQGLGVRRDPAEAYKWYLIAARSGDEQSKSGAELLRPKLDDGDRQAAERAAAAFHATDPDPASIPAP